MSNEDWKGTRVARHAIVGRIFRWTVVAGGGVRNSDPLTWWNDVRDSERERRLHPVRERKAGRSSGLETSQYKGFLRIVRGFWLVGWVGLEPTANGLKGRCSTTELPTPQTQGAQGSVSRKGLQAILRLRRWARRRARRLVVGGARNSGPTRRWKVTSGSG